MSCWDNGNDYTLYNVTWKLWVVWVDAEKSAYKIKALYLLCSSMSNLLLAGVTAMLSYTVMLVKDKSASKHTESTPLKLMKQEKLHVMGTCCHCTMCVLVFPIVSSSVCFYFKNAQTLWLRVLLKALKRSGWLLFLAFYDYKSRTLRRLQKW